MSQRNELRFGRALRREQLAIAEIHAGDAALAAPVVPRFDDGIPAFGAHGPTRNRLAEDLRDVVLRHPLLQRKEFRARHGEMIESYADSAQCFRIVGVVRQHRAIEPDCVALVSERHELTREVELDAAVDLSRAAMGIFDRDRWQRLQPLLDHALDLSSEQRVSWLVGLWMNDSDMANELIVLLSGEAEADDSGFLVDTPDALPLAPVRAAEP